MNPPHVQRPAEAPITLRELAELLRDGRRPLAASLAGALALGVLSTLLTQPVYRAEGLLHIEDRVKALDPLRDAAGPLSAETPSEAEMDLIRSRSMAQEVVEE